MTIVTTIYWAHLDPVREPATGGILESNVSDLKLANRKLVVVYQGTNHALPTDSNGYRDT